MIAKQIVEPGQQIHAKFSYWQWDRAMPLKSRPKTQTSRSLGQSLFFGDSLSTIYPKAHLSAAVYLPQFSKVVV